MHRAGVPRGAAYLTGTGETVRAPLVRDPRIAGVAFYRINRHGLEYCRTLAKTSRSYRPFLSPETGGQNAMIVDSSAFA